VRRFWLMVIAVLLVAAPAAAQQGSVQITTASQVTTGDPERTGGLQGFQPDFGFTWFQPTTTWGTLNFDAHAVRGGNDPRLGRALFAIKNMKRNGLTWNLSAGDSAYTPFLTDYGFNNLFAPQVTFRGASVAASGVNTSLSITAGRVTVFRDLFAANADTLGQSLLVARASQKMTKWFEVVAHASRVRTQDLKEFNYLIESSDDAGAGVRVNVTKTVQVIADAGMTSYRRKDTTNWEQKPSMLVGARWTGERGWFQLDAHRFSPGNFSVLNNPYADRQGLFAAGEYKIGSALRMFGGWDMFENDRQAKTVFNPWNDATSSRGYGGARLRINSHLSLGGRIEDGARTSKPSQYSVGYDSDTGAKSAEWQLTFAKWSANGRYERRSNVSLSDGLIAPSSTFTQHDVSQQIFYSVNRTTRLFTTLFLTERRDQTGGGQSFWQASAGTQVQLSKPNMFAHGEVILSRNRELQSDYLTPRSAFSGGLTAQIAKHVALSLDVFIDRSPVHLVKANPWVSRTMLRLVYTLPTGSPATTTATGAAGNRMPRGSETIEGTVFVDWNANGVHEADEETLDGVGVVLDGVARTTADQKGRFRFDHVVGGAHVIKVDLASIPADFDPPATSVSEVTARRNDVPSVAFGVLPVGDIEGVVLQDVDGQGALDEGDAPVDGAVVILDDGARTEVVRNGMFTFSGVRMGTHTVQLLLESLPDGAAIAGEQQIEVEVSRQRRTPVVGYLVKLDKRPEIRKVFTPKKVDGGKPDSSVSGGSNKSGGNKIEKSGNTRSTTGGAKSGTSKSGHTKSTSSNTKSGETK